MITQCETHNEQTGTRCILAAGHDGQHAGMYYPADAEPRKWYWEPRHEFVDRESRKKLGT